MNQPWVYNVPHLEPPSPSHPSGSSQCSSPEHPVSCIEPGLMISFTYGNIHVSMLFSQIIPRFPSPTESKSLFFTSGFHNLLIHFLLALIVYNCCSVTKSCPTLCNPMDGSTPGFSVLHHLPELSQTHVHSVGDAIQPSYPLSPSCFLFLLSIFCNIRVFSSESALHIRWPKYWTSASASVLPMNNQGPSFRIDWFDLFAVQGTLKSLLQHP